MDQPTLQDLVRRFKIPEHVLNGELSEKHLRDVTRFIDHNTLGPELGLTSQNMNDINVVVGPEDLRRIATLRKWKQTFAYNATYRKLIEALLKCSKADQAVEVCKLLIQSTCKCIIYCTMCLLHTLFGLVDMNVKGTLPHLLDPYTLLKTIDIFKLPVKQEKRLGTEMKWLMVVGIYTAHVQNSKRSA